MCPQSHRPDWVGLICGAGYKLLVMQSVPTVTVWHWGLPDTWHRHWIGMIPGTL